MNAGQEMDNKFTDNKKVRVSFVKKNVLLDDDEVSK